MTQTTENGKTTLEDYITEHQQKWSDIISSLNNKMKQFADLPELQNEVYAKRQDALDYYHNLLSKISNVSKTYKQQYADLYNKYKTMSQIRYSSESALNAQITSDLRDLICNIELLQNHSKYMLETIKTIDSIIYGITNRIRIEELIRNVN